MPSTCVNLFTFLLLLLLLLLFLVVVVVVVLVLFTSLISSLCICLCYHFVMVVHCNLSGQRLYFAMNQFTLSSLLRGGPILKHWIHNQEVS
jgi:hypothetical protein